MCLNSEIISSFFLSEIKGLQARGPIWSKEYSIVSLGVRRKCNRIYSIAIFHCFLCSLLGFSLIVFKEALTFCSRRVDPAKGQTKDLIVRVAELQR